MNCFILWWSYNRSSNSSNCKENKFPIRVSVFIRIIIGKSIAVETMCNAVTTLYVPIADLHTSLIGLKLLAKIVNPTILVLLSDLPAEFNLYSSTYDMKYVQPKLFYFLYFEWFYISLDFLDNG